MPNWCRGTLKVRGTTKNITRFILDGLLPVGRHGEERPKLSLNYDGDIFSGELCWIEGTRRGFVEMPEIYLSERKEEETFIAFFDAKFAWAIDAEALRKLSDKYHVDIKIYGFESGMRFNQDVEIIDGEIVKNEEVKFENYPWDCICPTLGG